MNDKHLNILVQSTLKQLINREALEFKYFLSQKEFEKKNKTEFFEITNAEINLKKKLNKIK